jgi:hypothetical protein
MTRPRCHDSHFTPIRLLAIQPDGEVLLQLHQRGVTLRSLRKRWNAPRLAYLRLNAAGVHEPAFWTAKPYRCNDTHARRSQ